MVFDKITALKDTIEWMWTNMKTQSVVTRFIKNAEKDLMSMGT